MAQFAIQSIAQFFEGPLADGSFSARPPLKEHRVRFVEPFPRDGHRQRTAGGGMHNRSAQRCSRLQPNDVDRQSQMPG
jgi:hypothetical protein